MAHGIGLVEIPPWGRVGGTRHSLNPHHTPGPAEPWVGVQQSVAGSVTGEEGAGSRVVGLLGAFKTEV